MNFELLLLIFVFILLGVIFFDYRKKKAIKARNSDENKVNSDLSSETNFSKDNTRSIKKSHKVSELENKFDDNINSNFGINGKNKNKPIKDEYVSKARVVNATNSDNTFAEAFESPKKSNNPERIICFYVKAKEGESFLGNDLLRVLLSLGCRYGDMKIFHRHEHKNGVGRELFSVASMLEPGNFDLNKLPDSKIPGVVLFFSTAKVINPLETYHLMLDAAKKLTQYLGGVLLDSKRQSLSPENITEMSELLASYINDAEENVI